VLVVTPLIFTTQNKLQGQSVTNYFFVVWRILEKIFPEKYTDYYNKIETKDNYYKD